MMSTVAQKPNVPTRVPNSTRSTQSPELAPQVALPWLKLTGDVWEKVIAYLGPKDLMALRLAHPFFQKTLEQNPHLLEPRIPALNLRQPPPLPDDEDLLYRADTWLIGGSAMAGVGALLMGAPGTAAACFAGYAAGLACAARKLATLRAERNAYIQARDQALRTAGAKLTSAGEIQALRPNQEGKFTPARRLVAKLWLLKHQARRPRRCWAAPQRQRRVVV